MEMILFVGLPGSGKSTYYKNHYFNSHLRISNDLLKTKNRTNMLLDFCRETNMSFVVDNTNICKSERDRFIKTVKEWSQKVCIRCIYFDCDVETCISRNQKRKGKDKIPDRAILSKAKIFEKPEIEEGFDELVVIKEDMKNEVYRIG